MIDDYIRLRICVGLLVAALLFLVLMWLFGPTTRIPDCRTACVNNLRRIDHAKEVLAIRYGWTSGYEIAQTPEAIWSLLAPYVGETNVPSCPKLAPGTHYIYGPIDTLPRCPYDKEHVYEPD